MGDAVPNLGDGEAMASRVPSSLAYRRATVVEVQRRRASLLDQGGAASMEARSAASASMDGESVRPADYQRKKSQEMPEPEKPPQTQQQKIRSKLETSKVATFLDREHLGVAMKGDIHSVKVLGEGAFGIVDLVVVDTPQGNLLCVRKKLLKQSDMNTCDPGQEVEFMERCSGNNFVVQMWSSVVGLYDYTLLLEYCPYNTLQHLMDGVTETRSKSGNGCLDFISISLLHVSQQAGLMESEARFYSACVALGLQSMHGKGMLHRDLKPANCLLAHNRYVKVADLGLAKMLGEAGRGYTKAGTPGYMAPEVFHSQGKSTGGYSYPADLWSLGVMLWEMVDGALPKWAHLSWYWTSLHFPPHFSNELKSLLTGLLEKSPVDRMTIDKMKAHAWFHGFDWEALEKQELEAPHPAELVKLHIHVNLLPENMRSLVVSPNASKYSK